MNAPDPVHMPRWGMTIDLNRCVGCQTCTAACKHANDTPPGVQWRRVIDVEQGRFPDVERLFVVTGCQHCEEPPCVPVCPTGATRKRDDGFVTIDYDQCIGCAYCVVSCPYQARTIVHEALGYFGGERTRQEQATAHPERVGVAQKCTFCVERVDAGLAQGLKPGVDPAATPACAASCIASAIQFGDFNDPQSNVSRLSATRAGFQMHEQLGTRPGIRYLYETPAVPGRASEAAENDDERLSDPANALVGARQRFWDWRAAMNWCFGGTGSGLAVMAWLAAQMGLIAPQRLGEALLTAGALMAVGLFCVFLKIGRQARFWRAALRPQTSWMTRELYAVAVFYPALAWVLAGGGAMAQGLVALSAVAFLGCQAMILVRARGIPAWRAPLIPRMIAASGMAEGGGALLVLLALAGTVLPGALAVKLIVLVLVNTVLWWRYRSRASAEGIGPLARQAIGLLNRPVHLIGHGLPLLAIIAALIVPAASEGLMLVAGLALVAGGFLWKFGVIVQAGYQQGFALASLPQRGSGRHAAPVRLKAHVRP